MYLEMTPVKCTIKMHAQNSLRKQPTLGDANTSFTHEVTSEKRVQKILREREVNFFSSKLAYITKNWFPLGAGKFHTDDASLPRFG